MTNESYPDQKIKHRLRKKGWVGLVLVASAIAIGVGQISDSLISVGDVGEKFVESIPSPNIRANAELITDTRGIYFVSTEEFEGAYPSFDPYSASDIAKVISDEKVAVLAGGGIPIKVRISNLTDDKLLNVEEVEIEVQDYVNTIASDIQLDQFGYTYTAGAPQAYDDYIVKISPSRKVYNALAFPVDYETGRSNNEDAAIGQVYHRINAGESDFLAIKVSADSPGIYRFSVKLKYSIDGKVYELPTDQSFSVLSLPESTTHLERASTDGQYTIQLGAFSELWNTLDLQLTLQARGFPVFVDESEEEGLFFVRGGNFGSKSEAEQYAAQTSLDKDFPIYIRERSMQ
ncbi:MAG: hypothetical protein F6K00_14355 [Leptolyngbya sp. SIOISBB]|nr:hypothetical protein [Leptolyngbya sp. SIOISBB]